jgi:hypothetical protein
MKLDDRGRKVERTQEMDLGDNVLIVDPTNHVAAINRANATAEEEPE